MGKRKILKAELVAAEIVTHCVTNLTGLTCEIMRERAAIEEALLLENR